jgi:thymidylate kinase
VKILILEGIATSGKSTIISLLSKRFNEKDIKIAGEQQTHEPIMKQTKDLHTQFYADLIDKMVATTSKLVVFDRLYLTQAFRAGVSLAEYRSIEAKLAKQSALTVFLRVDEGMIANRVAKAAEHREADWGDYIKTKGKDINEIANYYIQQQQSLIELLKTSSLPYLICDTTSYQYETIAGQILDELG